MAGEDLHREDHREDNTGEQSFDDLAKGLANGSISRGRAIKFMGTALLGGMLASIPGIAYAAHGGGHAAGESQGCPSGQVRVKGRCEPITGRCDQHRDCASPEDLCCNGVCTHVVFDRNNCGRCGNVCPEGYTCSGDCIPA